MNSGYALHLEAFADLDDIRYYLAWVVAVVHARRNPRIMAAILRGRE